MLLTGRIASAAGAAAIVACVGDATALITNSVHLSPPAGRGRLSEAKSGEGLHETITGPSPGSDLRSSPPSPRFAGRGKARKHQLDLSHGSERFGHAGSFDT